MPTARKVRHSKFPVDRVLFDDGDFSIAWGTYNNDQKRLGVRWNKEPKEPGYPKQGKYGTWFLISQDLAYGFVNALLGVKGYFL